MATRTKPTKAGTSRSRVGNDRQLADVDVRDAKRRWKEGLPCNLKQIAVALEISYSAVRSWARMAGFPMVKGFVFAEDFHCWRRTCYTQVLETKTSPRSIEFAPVLKTTANAPDASKKQARAIYKLAGI